MVRIALQSRKASIGHAPHVLWQRVEFCKPSTE
jgi:hypothetical protein